MAIAHEGSSLSSAGCRCSVSIEGSQPGFIASLWRSKKSRKHDELQGTLQRGDKVLDTIHGRCACMPFYLKLRTLPKAVLHLPAPVLKSNAWDASMLLLGD